NLRHDLLAGGLNRDHTNTPIARRVAERGDERGGVVVSGVNVVDRYEQRVVGRDREEPVVQYGLKARSALLRIVGERGSRLHSEFVRELRGEARDQCGLRTERLPRDLG